MENKIIRVKGTRKENSATNDKVFPHFLRVGEQNNKQTTSRKESLSLASECLYRMQMISIAIFFLIQKNIFVFFISLSHFHMHGRSIFYGKKKGSFLPLVIRP